MTLTRADVTERHEIKTMMGVSSRNESRSEVSNYRQLLRGQMQRTYFVLFTIVPNTKMSHQME